MPLAQGKRQLLEPRVTSHQPQANRKPERETGQMQCGIRGCPGEYEERAVVHTVRHRGRIVVIDAVPAEVCSVCGDVLLKPETVRHIDELLETRAEPVRTAPLYEYS